MTAAGWLHVCSWMTAAGWLQLDRSWMATCLQVDVCSWMTACLQLDGCMSAGGLLQLDVCSWMSAAGFFHNDHKHTVMVQTHELKQAEGEILHTEFFLLSSRPPPSNIFTRQHVARFLCKPPL